MSSSALTAPRQIRLAAAAYAASLLGVLAFGLLLSIGNRDLQAEYAAKVQLLDGLRRTGAAGGAKAGASAAQSAAILAPTETLAASQLQKQIVDRLKGAGGSVQSAQAEPIRETASDGLQRLVAKLTFDSSITALQRLLFDLETGSPFMFVDTLVAQPASSAPGMRAGETLRVTLVVSSYWKASQASPRVP